MQVNYPSKIIIQRIISQTHLKKLEWQAYYDDEKHLDIFGQGESANEALLQLQKKFAEKYMKSLQDFVNIFNYRLEKTT